MKRPGKTNPAKFSSSNKKVLTAPFLQIVIVSSRAFKDAPHSRFRCGDPNKCLLNFLKILLLALPQIYTRVFHMWKSLDLHSAWVTDSRPYQRSFLL